MKHGVRSFPDKRSKQSRKLLRSTISSFTFYLDPGAERFRFMLTLRDTPVDYINITCWASEIDYITTLHSSFKICDVGKSVSRRGNVLHYNVCTVCGHPRKWLL